MTLAACVANVALAAKGDSWLGLQFGSSIPTSDLRQSASPGFAGGLEFQYMDAEHSGAGLTVAYHAWRQTDHPGLFPLTLFGPNWGYRLQALETTAHVLVDLPPAGIVTPHVRVGAGLYWLHSKLLMSGAEFSDSDTRLGYNAGLGVLLGPPSANGVGFDGTYHLIQAPNSKWAKAITLTMTLRSGRSGRD